MSYPMNEIHDEMKSLAVETGDLMEAAKSAAFRCGDEIRGDMAAAVNRGRIGFLSARKRAIKDARAADMVVHGHVYQSIMIGVGVGVLAGYFAARRIAGS